MNVQFFDNNGRVPQPKHKIKLEDLKAELYADRRRVWVQIKVTPFQERPNLILAMRRKSDDHIVSELSIIETMHWDMEFTMHIRGADDPAGEYTVTVDLFYETKNPPQDQQTISFEIPAEV